ncbi:N-acetylmuramic acid 6-phosphate etherase [Parapedobacter sp.]
MEKPLTEQESSYQQLEQQPVARLLEYINREDHSVSVAVHRAINQIEDFVTAALSKMEKGGRLIYIGAGTSGRLGILDASECPPTFGIAADRVVGLIAGGDRAIRNAVEFAEDDETQGWNDLMDIDITADDVVLGISASGSTPYTLATLCAAKQHGIRTGCIVCNAGSPIAREVAYPITVVTGPEFVTGSTRMKAGTAQKMVLNMISTAVMIRLGKVKGNKMVDMQLTNTKLTNRGITMLMDETGINAAAAARLIAQHKNVRKALASINCMVEEL